MAATNSVALHIRRGDYLKKEVMQLYGNPCNEEYYKKAIEEVTFMAFFKKIHLYDCF